MASTHCPFVPTKKRARDADCPTMPRGVSSTILPSLRVVALTYTGLAGIAAMIVVVTAAIMPRTPILEQVTEPARQVVTTFVQPTTDLVSSFIAPPTLPLPPPTAAKPSAFVATTRLNVVIDSPPAVLDVTIAPVAPTPRPRLVYAPPPAPAPLEEVIDDSDDVVDDEMDFSPVGETRPVEQIVEAPPVMQMASVATPVPLPTATVVIPTTEAQVKAQTDAANQAAIDAAKAAAAAAKARDNAANQAAIDAQKVAAAKQKH